jgi:hypothetical protein
VLLGLGWRCDIGVRGLIAWSSVCWECALLLGLVVTMVHLQHFILASQVLCYVGDAATPSCWLC